MSVIASFVPIGNKEEDTEFGLGPVGDEVTGGFYLHIESPSPLFVHSFRVRMWCRCSKNVLTTFSHFCFFVGALYQAHLPCLAWRTPANCLELINPGTAALCGVKQHNPLATRRTCTFFGCTMIFDVHILYVKTDDPELSFCAHVLGSSLP